MVRTIFLFLLSVPMIASADEWYVEITTSRYPRCTQAKSDFVGVQFYTSSVPVFGQAPEFALYDIALDSTVPTVTNHPASSEVPVDGLLYRLLEGTNITLWYVRQGDLLATQLSSHNAAGDHILRTVNLVTGEDIEFNMSKMFEANTWAQARGNRQVRTNQSIRARGNR